MGKKAQIKLQKKKEFRNQKKVRGDEGLVALWCLMCVR
jgi:hypothetical protein